MPRLSIQQNNFTAGEISPRLVGRTDIDRYGNAARTLLNCYPVIHGGVKRRPGSLYVAATKFSAKKSRLIPFVYSRDDAYMLEFGDTYLRVYKNRVYTGVEVSTPFTEAMLPDIDYVQGADTMFISHPLVPIQRVRRFTDAIWDLSAAPFVVQPFEEQGHYLAANLTLSSAAVGSRTIAASAGVFLPSDVGRVLVSGAGQATVTAYSSATSITATVAIPFAGTALASQSWFLDASPQALLRPLAKDPVAATIDLLSSLSRAADITLSAKTGTITITASTGVFVAGDVGKNFYADAGLAQITGFTSATVLAATISQDFAAGTYVQGGWGISADAFRSEDVGKFLRINGGLCRVTSFQTAGWVKGMVLTALSSVVVSPPLAWSLESSVWSAVAGYPRTVTLHEQRLVAAGSPKFPQTIWGSRTGEYLDFTKGSNDTDSYSFTISSDEINPIGYLASLRNLVAHTYGGELSLQGGVEKPISPTNVRIRPETSHGSKSVRPVTIGKQSVFVQRAGRKVRTMGYTFEVDGYAAPDLSVLAEHITESGITCMAYQQEPDQTLWAVRTDGAMVSCTIDREQQVTGWARHYTDGAFESVATIPAGDREETWVIVRRIVNGVTVRYVEVLDDTFAPILPQAADPSAFPPIDQPAVYGCMVDSGLAFDNAAGQDTFNVPHLIGKTVDIVADGAALPSQLVDITGVVVLPRLSFRTLIGLHYRSEVAMLTPEVGTGTGTAQGNSMRISEITLRFLDTIGARVLDGEGNEQEVPFRHFGTEVLDKPPEPYTGNVRVETLGWDRGRCEFTVVQDQPLPMHLLAVVRKFQVND